MKRKGIFLLTIMMLTIVSLVLLLHSSYFDVVEVEIDGIHQLKEEQILQAGGKLVGENIFLIPGRELVNRLMDYTRVKGVKLERKLPDTLLIKIDERSGLALFKDINEERWYEVSLDGWVLGVYTDSLPQLPHVQGLEIEVEENRVKMTTALADLLDLLDQIFYLQESVSEVSYDPFNIVVHFTTGTKLYLGQAVEIQEKISLFNLIREDNRYTLDDLDYINLRYPGNPVICPRSGN